MTGAPRFDNPRDATRGGVNGPALPGHPPEGGHGKGPLRIDNAPARLHGERYRRLGWWRDATFLDDLRAAAARTPDRPAIIAARAFARDVTTVSYGELAGWVDRLAAGLVELGVEREDIVAVQLPSWWQYNALALACARIGAVLAPIPVDYRRREVEFVLSRTAAVVYIGPAMWLGFSHQGLLRELAPALPALRHRILIGADAHAAGELAFDAAFLADHARRHPPAELDRRTPGPDDVFLIMYTSGTTGEPKGVVHSYNTLYAITRAVTETAGLGAGDVITTPSSVTGMVGFLYDFLVPLHSGATAVYADLGDPDRGLAQIEQHAVSFLYGLPNYVLALIDAQRRRPRRISTLRTIVTGSAPVPPHLIGLARDVLGVRVQTLWGMTETGGVTFTWPDDPPDWPAHSDGRPIDWMELDVADETDGVGRLRVRGANQCLGYFQRPDMYAAAIAGDGWFETGDLVRRDGRGGIRIVGRIKDVIVRNGYKVPVVEVESELAAHPQIAMVALVPDPDVQLGERICAVVVPRDPAPTLAELRDHLRAAGMSAHYWPDRLHLVREMPLTSTGKIQKYALAELLRTPDPAPWTSPSTTTSG
ncbi:MAG TPA: AMP-binding protein [Kofleriaceae bacterium]|jgi:cyclohexanecarboxylate-CoA ligase|nr:AMP-binding protein [Kofleriaceae bacterium]